MIMTSSSCWYGFVLHDDDIIVMFVRPRVERQIRRNKIADAECSTLAGVSMNVRVRLIQRGKQERCMSKIVTRLTVLAVCSMALIAAPSLRSAYAAGGDTPSPPATDSKATKEKKKSGDKSSSIEDPAFLKGYRAAYTTIYDRGDYAAAIDQLKALGHEDRADVANLLGYSYRKLGNYQVSQVYYEKALQDDPNHVRTWQYYGLWQIEQGNRDQAQYHLGRIGAICGTDCAEYKSLASALEQPPGTGLVY
jgi:Flp pilus assembly protein TadD